MRKQKPQIQKIRTSLNRNEEALPMQARPLGARQNTAGEIPTPRAVSPATLPPRCPDGCGRRLRLPGKPLPGSGQGAASPSTGSPFVFQMLPGSLPVWGVQRLSGPVVKRLRKHCCWWTGSGSWLRHPKELESTSKVKVSKGVDGTAKVRSASWSEWLLKGEAVRAHTGETPFVGVLHDYSWRTGKGCCHYACSGLSSGGTCAVVVLASTHIACLTSIVNLHPVL